MSKNLAVPETGESNVSISVRQIENGFIVSRSSIDKKGNYKSSEHYMDKAPEISVAGKPATARPKAPAKPASTAAARPAASPARRK